MRSLSFFEDVQKEHILFKQGHKVSLGQIKKYLEKSVRLRELKCVRENKEKGKDLER